MLGFGMGPPLGGVVGSYPSAQVRMTGAPVSAIAGRPCGVLVGVGRSPARRGLGPSSSG
jgi:hypothetical protein